MADIKEAFADAADLSSGFSITLSTLADDTSSVSAKIDNTTELYLDDLVQVALTTAASGVSTTGIVNVYAQGSVDGTTFSDSANDKLIGVLNANDDDTDFAGVFSVALAFGGTLPPYYKIRVENESGAALTACTVKHRPTYDTSLVPA